MADRPLPSPVLAAVYRRSVPRFVLSRALSRLDPTAGAGLFGCVRVEEVAEPRLPGPGWVRVEPILSGICGSDLATIASRGSAYFSPLASYPFVLGHEIVGRVREGGDAAGLPPGTRVVVEPVLHCAVRGIAPTCDPCREGRTGNCERVTAGALAAGVQTGCCRDTGGGFGASLVAHASQVHRVPDGVSDEAAVLAEPLACAVHAVLAGRPGDADAADRPAGPALVLGCGTIGLLTIAALRDLAKPERVVAAAKYAHQAALAAALGADDVVGPGGGADGRTLAAALGARELPVEFGRPTVIEGGAAQTWDCVGSSRSIGEALRLTRARGTVVLVGLPGVPRGIDWTPLWHREIRVLGAYTYGSERAPAGGARRTFEIALDLLRRKGDALAKLVTHRFPIQRFRDAVRTASSAGSTGSVKVVLSRSAA